MSGVNTPSNNAVTDVISGGTLSFTTGNFVSFNTATQTYTLGSGGSITINGTGPGCLTVGGCGGNTPKTTSGPTLLVHISAQYMAGLVNLYITTGTDTKDPSWFSSSASTRLISRPGPLAAAFTRLSLRAAAVAPSLRLPTTAPISRTPPCPSQLPSCFWAVCCGHHQVASSAQGQIPERTQLVVIELLLSGADPWMVCPFSLQSIWFTICLEIPIYLLPQMCPSVIRPCFSSKCNGARWQPLALS